MFKNSYGTTGEFQMKSKQPTVVVGGGRRRVSTVLSGVFLYVRSSGVISPAPSKCDSKGSEALCDSTTPGLVDPALLAALSVLGRV